MTGLALATSWLTVLPVRGPRAVDRRAAAAAIRMTPVVGAGLGVVVAAVAWAGIHAGLAPALAGVLAVAAHALCTRGMHIDGLSDTVDGLGCYGGPERVREVMKSGGAGPFGVAALALCLGAQAFAIGQLADSNHLAAVVVAAFAGRAAVVAACRTGWKAASDNGFGALVAGTQRPVTIGIWFVLATAAGALCVPDRRWQGVVAVAVILALALVLTRHCVRRFGGLVGDILGADIELVSAAVLVACVIGS